MLRLVIQFRLYQFKLNNSSFQNECEFSHFLLCILKNIRIEIQLKPFNSFDSTVRNVASIYRGSGMIFFEKECMHIYILQLFFSLYSIFLWRHNFPEKKKKSNKERKCMEIIVARMSNSKWHAIKTFLSSSALIIAKIIASFSVKWIEVIPSVVKVS